LLDVAAVATVIGTTEKTIRARIARRQLPYLRLGGRIVIRRAALLQYLQSLEVVSVIDAVEASQRTP
jgi:excisionase family DNA binding protein